LAKLIDAHQGVQQASLDSNVMEVTKSKSQSSVMEVEAASSTESIDTSYIVSMDECLRIAVANAVKQIGKNNLYSKSHVEFVYLPVAVE
jgi:hypothetical protein